MIHYCTVYNTETGEIMSCSNFSINDDPEAIAKNYSVRVRAYGEDSHKHIPIESNPEIHYVVTLNDLPTVVERPRLLVNIDKVQIEAGEFSTLTGIPDPCRIVIDAADPTVETQTYDIDGGGFEFEPESPGVYTIEVHRFPFLPWRVEITAS